MKKIVIILFVVYFILINIICYLLYVKFIVSVVNCDKNIIFILR